MDYLGPILDPPGPPPGSGPLGRGSHAPREATRGGRDNLWHFSAKHLYFGRLKLSKTSQKRLKMVILEGFGRGLGGVWRGSQLWPSPNRRSICRRPPVPNSGFGGFRRISNPLGGLRGRGNLFRRGRGSNINANFYMPNFITLKIDPWGVKMSLFGVLGGGKMDAKFYPLGVEISTNAKF